MAWAIDDLATRPEWLSTIVQWHHEEWLRSVLWQKLSDAECAKIQADRAASMQAHLGNDAIPRTFVAHDGQEPWGTASLVYYQMSFQQPRSVWLTNMYVVPHIRDRGLGTAILEHAVAQAFALGITELKLYTFDMAPFYFRRGWSFLRQSELRGQRIDILIKRTSAKNIVSPS